MGGRLTPNSGAVESYGGDFKVTKELPQRHRFLVEHKYTNAKSFRITTNMLDKIAGEARDSNRRPAMIVSVGGCEYVVLRLEDLDWEEE